MTSSTDMSSNELEMNPMKAHIDKSQEVSSTVMGPNRKNHNIHRAEFTLVADSKLGDPWFESHNKAAEINLLLQLDKALYLRIVPG